MDILSLYNIATCNRVMYPITVHVHKISELGILLISMSYILSVGLHVFSDGQSLVCLHAQCPRIFPLVMVIS